MNKHFLHLQRAILFTAAIAVTACHSGGGSSDSNNTSNGYPTAIPNQLDMSTPTPTAPLSKAQKQSFFANITKAAPVLTSVDYVQADSSTAKQKLSNADDTTKSFYAQLTDQKKCQVSPSTETVLQQASKVGDTQVTQSVGSVQGSGCPAIETSKVVTAGTVDSMDESTNSMSARVHITSDYGLTVQDSKWIQQSGLTSMVNHLEFFGLSQSAKDQAQSYARGNGNTQITLADGTSVKVAYSAEVLTKNENSQSRFSITAATPAMTYNLLVLTDSAKSPTTHVYLNGEEIDAKTLDSVNGILPTASVTVTSGN